MHHKLLDGGHCCNGRGAGGHTFQIHLYIFFGGVAFVKCTFIGLCTFNLISANAWIEHFKVFSSLLEITTDYKNSS